MRKESYLARVTNTGSRFDGSLVWVYSPEADSKGRVQTVLYGWENNDGGAIEIAESCLVRI
jgi:hypothetical protein